MIHGIGVDILRESRIEKVWARHGDKLAQRILCEAERGAFQSQRHPVRFLAKAFAIKEAAAKALGTGFTGISYRDIGSTHDAQGRRLLVFSPSLQQRLDALGIAASHVSLSDEGGLVCAMVVLER